ncbi:MAG: hypothetical protein J7598_24735 [Mitsuaria chitosanitabida]|uniref:hypothetical protein n=1 Tax=Roseateles chitosanitabidus TaxID=65048 RepID=UPI001B258204|nr:hypothetical protein [Roseateles chitosanitabidus]MBO9689821.1 hypothetical protein [Roseateles chitosanitabidus]
MPAPTPRPVILPLATIALAATIALTGCSPALNWRKVQPEGAQLELMFPCKPEREERAQPGPAGQPVTLRTLSCKAQGGQYSLTWTDLGDTGATSTAMHRMHEGLARRLAPGASAPLGVRGIASDPEAFQQVFEHRPGQPAQQVRQAVFSRGGRLYQLLLQGERADAAAWDVFVGSVQLPPT